MGKDYTTPPPMNCFGQHIVKGSDICHFSLAVQSLSGAGLQPPLQGTWGTQKWPGAVGHQRPWPHYWEKTQPVLAGPSRAGHTQPCPGSLGGPAPSCYFLELSCHTSEWLLVYFKNHLFLWDIDIFISTTWHAISINVCSLKNNPNFIISLWVGLPEITWVSNRLCRGMQCFI